MNHPIYPNGKRDHPRVCGEKSVCIIELWQQAGSPPRVRGKENKDRCDFCRTRITPACAGKRACASSSYGSRRDHPRVCGEKKIKIDVIFAVLGSPPRVRGKDLPYGLRYYIGRITPACAGKRRLVSGCGSGAEDHPRVCGEKTKKSP